MIGVVRVQRRWPGNCGGPSFRLLCRRLVRRPRVLVLRQCGGGAAQVAASFQQARAEHAGCELQYMGTQEIHLAKLGVSALRVKIGSAGHPSTPPPNGRCEGQQVTWIPREHTWRHARHVAVYMFKRDRAKRFLEGFARLPTPNRTAGMSFMVVQVGTRLFPQEGT